MVNTPLDLQLAATAAAFWTCTFALALWVAHSTTLYGRAFASPRSRSDSTDEPRAARRTS